MKHDVVLALLALGCLCELLCVAGVLWMRDGFDQLHYASAATTVGLVAFLAAVLLQGQRSTSGTVDCAVALGLTFLLGPFLVAATARAGRRMRLDTIEPLPAEFRAQPADGDAGQ